MIAGLSLPQCKGLFDLKLFTFSALGKKHAASLPAGVEDCLLSYTSVCD